MITLVLPRAQMVRSRRWIPWIVGLACGVTVWLTACSVSILGTDPDTGLDILVRRGPIRPVEEEGQINSRPVEGALVLIRRTDASGDARVRTDAEGRVIVQLLPGAYRVEVRECPGALSLPDPEDASVASGELTALELLCDTGIR